MSRFVYLILLALSTLRGYLSLRIDRHAPRNLTLQVVNSTTVKATWQHPLDITGHVRAYYVYWSYNDGFFHTFNAGRSESYVLTGLQPEQNVTVFISTYIGNIQHHSNVASVITPPLPRSEVVTTTTVISTSRTTDPMTTLSSGSTASASNTAIHRTTSTALASATTFTSMILALPLILMCRSIRE